VPAVVLASPEGDWAAVLLAAVGAGGEDVTEAGPSGAAAAVLLSAVGTFAEAVLLGCSGGT
jgi:hypothetical protein